MNTKLFCLIYFISVAYFPSVCSQESLYFKEGETQEEYTARYLRTKEAILRNHPSTHRDALPETIAFLYYAITTLASYYHPTGSEHQRILSTDSLLDLKESSRQVREEIATAWAMYEAEKDHNFSPALIRTNIQLYKENVDDNYVGMLHDIGLILCLPHVSLRQVPDRPTSPYSSFLNSGFTHPLWR